MEVGCCIWIMGWVGSGLVSVGWVLVFPFFYISTSSFGSGRPLEGMWFGVVVVVGDWQCVYLVGAKKKEKRKKARETGVRNEERREKENER